MQTFDYAAAAKNYISVYKFPIIPFDQWAGLAASFSSIISPSVFGDHFANLALSQKTALKNSLLTTTKKKPWTLVPNEGCVHGVRIYKEGSFGRSYKALTDILRWCWKKELVHATTTIAESRYLWPHMSQCALASTSSLHTPHQPHT